MELKLNSSKKNNFPVGAFLIKSPSTRVWIQEFQKIGFAIESLEVYPIPDTTANSIWGCIAIFDQNKSIEDFGKNMFCQSLQDILYIPENSNVFPTLSSDDLLKLFRGKKHLFHPDFGLVELLEELDWANVLDFPQNKKLDIIEPANSVHIPFQIRSFQIKPIEPENALEEFEKKVFPKQEKIKNTKLNLLEKIKLRGYKSLFSKSKKGGFVTEKPLLKAFEKVGRLLGKKSKWKIEFQKDFENLEERNQKELEKFLKLMENNPEEALKYAMPLDQNGSSRGDMKGSFQMSKIWNDYSFLSKRIDYYNSGRGVQMEEDTFERLNRQYNKTAQLLIEQKNYEKAAFVYMKLLKNDYLAAQTLENGKLYQEAASIYLTKLNNHLKAAECYEKGKMTYKAIELYKGLDQNEKVGDLFMTLNEKKEAHIHYKIEATNKINKKQYLTASMLYKNKMGNLEIAQSLLLTGWRDNHEALKCLDTFFDNTEDIKIKENQYRTIYKYEVNNTNYPSFLKVLQAEFEKQNDIQAPLKDIAYQLISSRAILNPNIIQELRKFNRDNSQISKDLTRFTLKKKNN